jgi:hypothetical protein
MGRKVIIVSSYRKYDLPAFAYRRSEEKCKDKLILGSLSSFTQAHNQIGNPTSADPITKNSKTNLLKYSLINTF